MTIEEILRQAQSLRDACASDPGLWNLLQAEQEWALYGDACDPLSPIAPERALKAFQRDIYLGVWRAPLASLATGASVMVAGGGTGRFAQWLFQQGFDVELVDASPEAIRRARQHLGPGVKVSLGDIAQEGVLRRASYDLVMAVEVACYATDPTAVMQQLRAAVRPGGTLLFSVEARPGVLLADRDLASPDAVRSVLEAGAITLPGSKHVHYYSRQEARSLAESVGFSVKDVEGVCYVPDGPFNALVDASRLEDPVHIEQLLSVEMLCRAHPVLRELPRAWAITAVA